MTTIKINSLDLDTEDLTVIVNGVEFRSEDNYYDDDDYYDDDEFYPEELTEVWRDVEGTGGDYKVSNLGNVMSYRQNKQGKLLTPYESGVGYKRVTIAYPNGERKRKKVARLVMDAFRPLPAYKRDMKEYQIDHINGDKSDNRLCNLEWVTATENIRRANQVIIPKSIVCLETGEVFESIGKAAKKFGVSHQRMSWICNRNTDQTWRGLTFRFLEDKDDE